MIIEYLTSLLLWLRAELASGWVWTALVSWGEGGLAHLLLYIDTGLGEMPGSSHLQQLHRCDRGSYIPLNPATLPETVVTPPQDSQGSREKHLPSFWWYQDYVPTVLSKLAQCISDLDFIELEELLPSNKSIHVVEGVAPYRTEGNHSGLATTRQEGGGHWHMVSFFLLSMPRRRPELVAPCYLTWRQWPSSNSKWVEYWSQWNYVVVWLSSRTSLPRYVLIF